MRHELHLLAEAIAFPKRPPDAVVVEGLLDGEFSTAYRRQVSLGLRRARGAFFTPSAMARDVVRRLPTNSPVYDPSFGAGDLLIAHSMALPVQKSLASTLKHWSYALRGIEIQTQLVEVAKLRLIVAALWRGAQTASHDDLDPARWFPHLKQGDFVTDENRDTQGCSWIMNPPFGTMQPREAPPWAAGSVSRAAYHLWLAVERSSPGSEIRAILPDVVRAGSRYTALRNELALRLKIEDVRVVGKFDAHADVDVFVLHGLSQDSAHTQWPSVQRTGSTVGDHFKVRVGPVVAYRDEEVGPLRRYAEVSSVPAWETVNRLGPPRGFAASLIDPPFVVVRRTSGPRDRHRAVASIITGSSPVLVENHLLICQPRDGSIETCKTLVSRLRQPSATEWLNCRIRCRHLTVGVVQEIPW